MSAKEKDSNTLTKLKLFFRMNKTPGNIREGTHFVLVPELERELQPETPVGQRCKALRDLGEDVKNNRLEDAVIKRLWDLTKDLIVPHKPAEQRQTALLFYQKLIQGQYENLLIMRGHFYRVIENHQVAEDIELRLSLLRTLTDNGKNITYFEESIGTFMLGWMPAIVKANLTDAFLEMLVNIIKFNAAYLEKPVVVGIIQHACYLSSFGHDPQIVMRSLDVLDAALCYTVFPTETLTICIVALCRTVTEQFCQVSWRIMKNLLGTNLGHVTLLTMCNILSDRDMYADETLVRGAVFHTNMGLWGQTGAVQPMLRCSPATVLASFRNALDSQRINVTYEVILSVHRLIVMNGPKLSESTWDVMIDILRAIAANLRVYERTSELPKKHPVPDMFHDTLTDIETYIQRNEIALDPAQFFALIEEVAEDRPVPSVLYLIDYRARQISATRPEWLQAMSDFVERFYRMRSVNIRVRTVQALTAMMECNRAGYEEEILERVVLPQFGGVHLEPDVQVRQSVARMLLDFARHCETKRCLELLDVVERLLVRPLELLEQSPRTTAMRTEAELADVITCVDGLVELFGAKLYRLPSSHAIRVFHLLVGHLERHYKNRALIEAGGAAVAIRHRIFTWMLQARANAGFYIGFPDATSKVVRFSNYLGLDVLHAQMPQQQLQQLQKQQSAEEKSSAAAATAADKSITSPEGGAAKYTPEPIPAAKLSTISIRRGCQRIVECLRFERDWSIMELVLCELPSILENRALLQGNDMESLAATLIYLYHNKNTLAEYTETAGVLKPSLTDFRLIVLTAISSLVPYHMHLNQRFQKEIIESLRNGMFLRNPRVCVNALTVMLLELPEQVLRQLPDVLLQMSKMSSTLAVAVPVLEFLSTLNRLPSHRFVNLIVVHYMYVFAITVPYTNPYKYDHYIVSLAHHVIAGWFLKCRLPLRRNFVHYIIKSFETNVQIPFQEIKKMDFAPVNEDSSNRKRSSSLTEQGSRRRDRVSLSNLPTPSSQQQQQQSPQAAPQPSASQKLLLPKQDALYNFHMELAETCIDFLARHTFSPCSALPKRLPSSEFILAGGQSQTWLVGHNLITITTSGCTSSQLKNGLCDRCSLMCRQPATATAPAAAAAASAVSRAQSSPQQLQQQQPVSPSAMAVRSDSADSAAAAAAAAVAAANKRYTKASLQHVGHQEGSGSTDANSSASFYSTSSAAAAAATPFSAQSSSDSGAPFSSASATGHTKFLRQSSNDGSSGLSGSGSGGLRFSSNSTSGSLEALTRRGSNPDQADGGGGGGGVGGNFGDSSLGGSSRLSQSSLLMTSPQRGGGVGGVAGSQKTCACSCTGWAEICVRRPTGNMSWVMRIQNQIRLENAAPDGESALHDIIGLFMPSLGGVFGPDGSGLLGDVRLTAEGLLSPVSPVPADAQTAAASVASPTPQRSVSVSVPPKPDQLVASAAADAANAEQPAKPREPTASVAAVAVQPPKSILKSDSSSSQSTSTGPIDIPRLSSQETKVSAGSFSDIEADADEEVEMGHKSVEKQQPTPMGDTAVDADGKRSEDSIAFDDGDESRSRNPVRRVNSSPEMSSSWRNPFLSQKGAPTAADHQQLEQRAASDAVESEVGSKPNVVAPSAVSPSVVVIGSASSAFADVDQQRKKSSTFGSNMRVSCEAIPEEIAGSTPPSWPKDAGKQSAVSAVAAAGAGESAASPGDQVTRAAAFAVSSASFPTADIAVIAPKKQLSADDALLAAATKLPATDSSASAAAAGSASGPVPSVSSVKLKLPMDMPKVTTKPPQSPTPLSPRLLAKNAANQLASQLASGGGGSSVGGSGLMFLGNGGSGNGEGGGNGNGNGNGNGDLIRGRSKTISVVRGEHAESRADALKWPFRGNSAPLVSCATRSGISPNSVFLQLYHTGPLQLSGDQPIQIGPTNLKAITLLDLIPPFETHNIGVLYIGPGQCNNEAEMFRNRYGSLRYTEFLRNLGTLVALKDAKEHHMFVNMESNGKDGKFTYIWQDDIVQVTFHVATLMPNRESDPNCYEKKKHIGNDFVTIVYNESGEEYNLNTIKGQFNYACVVVQPLELNTSRIVVRIKDDVAKFVSPAEPKILSDASAPLYARQLALHANLASLVAQSLKTRNQSPYASNWLERLRKIKHLRTKLLKENSSAGVILHPDNPVSGANSNNNNSANSSINNITTANNNNSSSSSINNLSNSVGLAGSGGGLNATAASGSNPNIGGIGAAGAAGVATASAAPATSPVVESPWLREDFTAYTQ